DVVTLQHESRAIGAAAFALVRRGGAQRGGDVDAAGAAGGADGANDLAVVGDGARATAGGSRPDAGHLEPPRTERRTRRLGACGGWVTGPPTPLINAGFRSYIDRNLLLITGGWGWWGGGFAATAATTVGVAVGVVA